MPYLAGAFAAAGTTLALVAGIWFAEPMTAWYLALMIPASSCVALSAFVFPDRSYGAADSERSTAKTVFRVVMGFLFIVLAALWVGLLVFAGALD